MQHFFITINIRNEIMKTSLKMSYFTTYFVNQAYSTSSSRLYLQHHLFFYFTSDPTATNAAPRKHCPIRRSRHGPATDTASTRILFQGKSTGKSTHTILFASVVQRDVVGSTRQALFHTHVSYNGISRVCEYVLLCIQWRALRRRKASGNVWFPAISLRK